MEKRERLVIPALADKATRSSPKAFECGCGQTFFAYTSKKVHACNKCKGMGKRTNKNIRPKPVWRTVRQKMPFCPKCGAEMKRCTGDAASMFTWQCTSLICHYVC